MIGSVDTKRNQNWMLTLSNYGQYEGNEGTIDCPSGDWVDYGTLVVGSAFGTTQTCAPTVFHMGPTAAELLIIINGEQCESLERFEFCDDGMMWEDGKCKFITSPPPVPPPNAGPTT